VGYRTKQAEFSAWSRLSEKARLPRPFGGYKVGTDLPDTRTADASGAVTILFYFSFTVRTTGLDQ
jgi:hypothetical protein